MARLLRVTAQAKESPPWRSSGDGSFRGDSTTPGPAYRSRKSSPEARPPCSSRSACCRSEEHTSELQSLAYLVCRLLLEKKKKKTQKPLLQRTNRRTIQSRVRKP